MSLMKPKGAIRVDGEVKSPLAHIQVVNYSFFEPPESSLSSAGNFRLELCLTPRHRSSRGCYADLWSPARFERIGDVFVAPPGMELLTRSDEQSDIAAVVCHLDSQYLLSLYDTLPSPTDQLLLASLDVRDVKVKGLMFQIAEEIKNPGFASALFVDALMAQTAIELFRLGQNVLERLGSGGLAPWQLRKIDARLNDIEGTPTLSELADLCRLSVRQLARGFKASKGYPIGAYVVSSQIEHAKRMLSAGESVADISMTLGFASPSNFCAAFKRVTNMTPGHYRKHLI